MADLTNVTPELVDRVNGVRSELNAHGIATTIAEGYRSLAEQQRLYDKMIAAQKAHPNDWQKYATLAAYPGTSMHGHDPSEAVDLDLVNPTAWDLAIYKTVANRWGLVQAVPSEYWHLQLDPKRGKMPTDVTKEEAMTMVIDPVGVVSLGGSDADGWAFGAQGHVYAFGTAAYFGGWDDQTRAGGRRCVALVPTVKGDGYFLVSDKGEIYAYGAAEFPGNYDASRWGGGQIIGALPNTHQPSGGVTLLRDDGQHLNIFAFPFVGR